MPAGFTAPVTDPTDTATMHRALWLRSWRRLAVQATLLAGIGLAFVGGPRSSQLAAAPPPDCQPESFCSLKKPLLLFLVDYSTSMNKDLQCQGTRWESTVDAIKLAIDHDNGFLASHYILGLMRFGHDPSPQSFDTLIPGDTSGLHDGYNLDVGFYDPDQPGQPYFECDQRDALFAALDAIPAPLGGSLTGIESWTRGAVQQARAYFNVTRAAHPADGDQRLRSILLITDGPWTNQQGTKQLAPATENPAPFAATLFTADNIPTHVVTLGEAAGHPFADELAAMGGTGQPLAAADPQALVDATKAVADDLAAAQLTPLCAPDTPRIMLLLDASSSMLNLQGGLVRAKQGEGGWEQARDTLAGAPSIFDQMLPAGEVQDLAHLGLSVFGGNMPDESKLIVQYGPCHKDNIGWALDPVNSCGDGCNDPYADAPITWTFQDGSMVPPNFADPTISHMPLCNQGIQPNKGCFGSGTSTHLGLLTVQTNLAAYKAACMDPMALSPCDADTPFLNILITDGLTNSAAAQYTPPLLDMFAQGVTTHVIGFGDGVDSPQAIASMNDMAAKGSGGLHTYHDANNQAQLEAALADILADFIAPPDPCCKLDSCDVPFNPSGEPDPIPETSTNPTNACSDSDSTSSTTTTDTTTTTSDSTTEQATTSTTTTTGEDPSTPSSSSSISMSATLTEQPSEPDPAPTTIDPSTTTSPTPTSDGPADPDTSSSEATGDPPQSADPGCGCRAQPSAAPLLAMVPLLLRRRRRAR